MKTEIVKEKIEVVRQVKLTSKQWLTLVSMQNDNSRANCRMDYTVRQDLQALGLIEERSAHTDAEKRKIHVEIADLWKSMPQLVRGKKLRELNQAVDSIDEKTWRLDGKAWWLTKAAEEYLVKGKVTITR